MTGETKHVYAIDAKVPTSKDSDSTFEQFNKDAADNKSTGASDNSESASIAETASQLNGRKKETHSQREAVIRPQQAGKIDFKSLQNRPKFSSEGTWTNGKNSPLSPTGKSRGKDKNKRTGKGDRNQQQLYRLSISSSRSNPTIGIAYPQQKVTPPKKVEVNQGPVSGSYRFHVPSIPEREVELHQEDVNFNRSLSETTSSLTSTNYTSQTVPASRISHGLKIQLGNLHDTVNANEQLHYLEFPPNGNQWHSPEKHFPATSGYAISNQKLCPFPEGNKSDSHNFVPVSFQYPFPSLQDHNGNSFCNNGNNQDFVEAALATNQVAHNNTFYFQSSSREGPEDQQGNGSYNTVLSDSRSYVPSQQAPFLHAQQGVQLPPTTPCYTGRNEHSADHSGAISSSGALNSSGAIEQTQSPFQDNQTVFNPSEFSLHSNSMPALLNKRQQSPKHFVHSQGLLAPGNTLRRNIPQTSLNKVQFASKIYTNVNTGSVPFDKTLSRIPQTWDAGSNNFPPLDQSAVSYANASGNLIPYQCQSNDQRQALKNLRIPWQQSQLNSTTASQNGVELPRNAGNQKIPYSHGTSDWSNSNTMPKISPSYHTKKPLMVEGSSTQRTDMNRQSYNSSNTDILYDSVKETNSQISDSRSKGLLYSMSQHIQQPRTNTNQPVSLSGNTFVAESPCESPLNSPINNPVSSSTCSSLSPMSSSPVNPSSDENQMPPTLISSPYFHQPCHPTEKSFHSTDSLGSGSLLYHNSETTKNFHFLSDASKDEQAFKNVQDNQYQKLANEPNKGCIENFESEPPPPYSSHHFLASSLSSANLDQLDVLLTCKQCDQNFSNLSSFLEHRQYCNVNSTLQNEMKDSPHGGDQRKSATEPLKSSQTIPGLSHPKGQMEFHSHLPGFNKDYLLDSDTKGDTKEDPMKCNIFQSLTPGLLPLAACDTLEMDDAKLDSLIIEALNGLEFQVDNPEIDSTFIDVFVDDDLTTSKAIGCSQQHKVQEPTETKKKICVEEKQVHHNQVAYEENYESEASYNHRNEVKTRKELKMTEIGTAHRFSLNSEANIKPLMATTTTSEWQSTGDIKKGITAHEKKKSKPDFEYSEEKDGKYYDSHQGRTTRNDSQDFSVADTPKSRKNSLQDIKKKKQHNGTWSKELIHKIVQQKNKLHKLHVKSNKNVQFSLVTERLFPPNKSHLFGEYDYISDSDEEVVANSLPGKLPNGRLKYSFNRDLPGRGNRAKIKEPVWRMGEATRFQLQNKDLRNTNKETSNRVRRRSSQSSNSSDQSTSISSETGSSPKSTERTDSETEQENGLMCNSFSTSTQKTTTERNMIKPIYRANLSEKHIHQDFSKGTKQYGSAKFLLASSKVYPSNNVNARAHYGETDKLRESTDSIKETASKTSEVHCFKNSEEKEQPRPYQKAAEANISLDNFSPDLIANIGNVSQEPSTFHADNTNYQVKQLDSCAPAISSTEVNTVYSNNSVKYLNDTASNGNKEFAIAMPCYLGDTTVNILPQQNHKSYVSECQGFPDNKDMPDLYSNNIFSKPQRVADTDVKQMYVNQSNTNNMISIENKCSDVISYPSDNHDKVSSALSFDSSSIFAELPITHFESPLYNSVTPTKDNYADYDQSNKSTHFEHQFSGFLQEKSWDLLRECAPMSSSSLSTFQALQNQSTEKYNEHAPISSEEMSIDIPRTITDYNAPFINNMSEDELEIKRLVTELENQLQTSKDHNDMTSETLSKHQLTPELTNPSLTLQEMEDNTIENCSKDAYFNETTNYVNDMKHIIQVDHLQDSQPLLKVDDSSESLKRSWTCSAQFDTFTSGIKNHKQARTLDSFTIPDNCKQYQPALTNVCLAEDLASLSNHSTTSVLPDACLTNLSHQGECQAYPETDLLRETLVTAETLFSKIQQNIDNAEKENKQSDAKDIMNTLQKLDDQFDEPPELEPFQSVSEFVLQDKNDSVLNITKTPEHENNITEEPLCNPVLNSTISKTVTDMEHSKKHLLLGDEECLQKNDSMPVLVKEECAKPEKATTLTEQPAENPLQQLQQFVARTAKNNEVEMLMPCFPMLLKPSGTAEAKSDTEGDFSPAVEGLSTCTVDSDITAKLEEQKEMPLLSESCELAEKSEQLDTGSEMLSETMSNDMHADGTSPKHFESKCSGLKVINVGKGVKRLDSDNPPPKSRVSDKLSQGLMEVNEEISYYGETNAKKSSSFPKKRKSTNSNHTLHNEEYTTETILTPKKLLHDKTHDSYLPSDALDAEVLQMFKRTEDQEPQNVNNDVSVFTSPANQQQHREVMQELLGIDNAKESSKLNDDKCTSDSVDKASTGFSFHPQTENVLGNTDNQYDTTFPTINLPTAHSMLGFDLLPHVSLKEPAQPQDFGLTSIDNDLNSMERHALSQVTQKCQNGSINIQEINLVKHSVEGSDVREDKSLTSSLEGSQEIEAEKESIKPVLGGNLTPCFCTELVCMHYKDEHAESVTDILGCQSIPTNDAYQHYTGENNHNFQALENKLYPDSIQTPVVPSTCSQKEETLKCDWHNTQGGSPLERVFPSKDDGSSAMVCDLMDITDPGLVNIDVHQKNTENLTASLGPQFNNAKEAEHVALNEDSGTKCTNDMHSVIDGVLRILEGDKSKEILQSIGMPPKSSPIKEKKSSGLSLTCDICSVSFRSKPGLTRHKAVKHNGTVAHHKDGMSGKSRNVKNKTCEWNGSNVSQQASHSQNINASIENSDCNLQPSLLISDKEKRILSAKNKGEKRTNGQFQDIDFTDTAYKKKLDGKIKKRKAKSMDSQGPPDDVLNILKTNILKAIGQSNSFNSSEEKLHWEESSDKHIALKETDLQNVNVETYSAAISIDEDEKQVSDVVDFKLQGESLLHEQTWTKSLTEHDKQVMSKDHTLLPEVEECLNADETVTHQKDTNASNLTTETVTDLHTLFDDDNTFSQLFPRDDHLTRRKCTRVYGKKSKKQTPSFEADLKCLEMVEHCHSPQISYAYNHRRISADSPLTDCAKPSAQTELVRHDHAEPPNIANGGKENKMHSFKDQNQVEIMSAPQLVEGVQDEKLIDVPTHISLYKPCAESTKMISDQIDSEVEVNKNCKLHEETGLPEFPTIDMKMLSAKFDMRELSFFSACGDDSDQSDLDASSDITQKTGRRKKQGKNKMDEKRQVRNRNSLKMKSKDKQYKCKVCFQWFLTLGELDFHKLTHNPSPPPTCYMCVQRKFSSREQLRDHLKEKHAKNKAGLWICGMCLKEISDVWMYNEHLREHATQFARKGQAQKSVMGIPGCFGEDNMVRTFLSTFIYRTPGKLSKTSEANDKIPVGKKTDQKEHKVEDEVVSEKEPENSVPPAAMHVKISVSPSLDNSQKSDNTHKNAAMHPHCKDPSRDCHHCGKQFPKPFKLQRHLVVHSLQKIYLCHKCPKSYQEVQELRSHLTSDHQLTEKCEIKHTTLYACELCADVMHVIKKSFICSTCNYTFSKKEQYDRHMEKHLIGGSMTFKFRGVTRPATSAKEIKEKLRDSATYESAPPSKKQKLSGYNDPSPKLEGIDHGDPHPCPKLSPSVDFHKEMEGELKNEYEYTVKLEEILMDAPELQAEEMQEPTVWRPERRSFSPKPCVSEEEKEDAESVSETLPMLDCEMTITSFDCPAKTADLAEREAEFTKIKDISTDKLTLSKQLKETNETLDIETSPIIEDIELSQLPLENSSELFVADKITPLSKNISKESQLLEQKIEVENTEDTSKSLLTDGSQLVVPIPPKENILVTDTNALIKDLKGLKKMKSTSQPNGRSAAQTNITASNGEEMVKSSTPRLKAICSQARDNGSCTLKETASQQKLTKREPCSNTAKNSGEFRTIDKMSASMPPKQLQKKRKEHKISGHKASTASQENLGEVKKKTNKLAVNGKSESSGNGKKPEWGTSHLDIKDESISGRPYPKPNAGGISGQLKKVVLDMHNQKKVNSHPSNGEYKCKKTLISKTLQPFTSKSSALTLNSPSQKRKIGSNTKPTEPSNYRTAESQNNLLSQLFGQKLTSFKIPLRRDITE